jgi:predicted nucleic acid-binding protein
MPRPLYLLDTSVFCQPIRPNPDTHCQNHWKHHGDDRLAVPAIAIAELEYGLFLKDSDKLWEAYRTILKGRLHVLDFITETASVFGELKARQTVTGKTVDDFDLAIAAIAVTHDLTVATLNVRHFQKIEGLKWEDWSKK